jgi:hypothetical protein
MENIEKEFTPEESLQMISQVINKTRKNIKVSSFYFILWGWVMIFASLSCFFIIKYFMSIQQFKYINLGVWLAWIVPVLIGSFISKTHERKMEQLDKTKSLIGNIIKMTWYSNGIGIILCCFISYKLHISPAPLIFIIIGLSTFMTGYIIKYKPIMYGGIVFWIFTLLSVFINNEYQLLLTAFSIVAGYLVPGYMLKNNKEE